MRHGYSFLLNIFSSEAVLNVREVIYLIISYQWSSKWDAGDRSVETLLISGGCRQWNGRDYVSLET